MRGAGRQGSRWCQGVSHLCGGMVPGDQWADIEILAVRDIVVN